MAEPVTLDIYEGEQVAILGPNGSGKTRLVEILTGRWPLLYGNEVRYDFGDANNRLVSENIKVMTFRDSYGDADTTYYLQKRWNAAARHARTSDSRRRAASHSGSKPQERHSRLYHKCDRNEKWEIGK